MDGRHVNSALFTFSHCRLRDIIRLWGKDAKGIALLDEVDQILHPLQSELNFPIGPKLKLLMSPERFQFPLHLLDGLLYFGNMDKDKHTDPSETKILQVSPLLCPIDQLQEIAQIIKRGMKLNLIDSFPHPTLLLAEFYQSNLRNAFGRWALIWLKQQKSVSDGLKKAAEAGLDVDKV